MGLELIEHGEGNTIDNADKNGNCGGNGEEEERHVTSDVNLNIHAQAFFVSDGASDVLQVIGALCMLRYGDASSEQGPLTLLVATLQALLSFTELKMTGFELGVDYLKYVSRQRYGAAPERLPRVPLVAWGMRVVQEARFALLVVTYFLTQYGVLDREGLGFDLCVVFTILILTGPIFFDGFILIALLRLDMVFTKEQPSPEYANKFSDGEYEKEFGNTRLWLVPKDSPNKCVLKKWKELRRGDSKVPLALSAPRDGLAIGLHSEVAIQNNNNHVLYPVVVPAADKPHMHAVYLKDSHGLFIDGVGSNGAEGGDLRHDFDHFKFDRAGFKSWHLSELKAFGEAHDRESVKNRGIRLTINDDGTMSPADAPGDLVYGLPDANAIGSSF